MHRLHISLIVVGTVAATVASLGLSGCRTAIVIASNSNSPVASTTSGAGASTASPQPSESAAPSPSLSPSPSVAPTPTIPASLAIGSSGAAVSLLQQRLLALGYWLSGVDGAFGATTQQAVYALQKAAGQSPSGVVTAKTWRALDRGVRPTARSTSGTVIEVDLKRDLILFVADGSVNYILNTSTGGGFVFYEDGQREVATTPRGHFTTYRVIDALHRAPLGLLYRPRYFFEGFAIHGSSSVPPYPVSHGCVRVTNAAINWIWSANLDPIGREVWTY